MAIVILGIPVLLLSLALVGLIIAAIYRLLTGENPPDL